MKWVNIWRNAKVNCVPLTYPVSFHAQYLQSGWLRDYSYRCQPVDYSPKGLRMAETCWWYYISKFTEFFDTLFFLLRKKNQHVSTLHVIHHGVMPFSGELSHWGRYTRSEVESEINEWSDDCFAKLLRRIYVATVNFNYSETNFMLF